MEPDLITMSLNLNGTRVHATITSEERVVNDWIQEIQGLRKYKHIGISVKGKEAAVESVHLYSNERCLLFKLGQGGPLEIGNELLKFFTSDQHVFVGQPHVEEKLTGPLANPSSLKIKNWMNGPAAKDYMTEAQNLLTEDNDELENNQLKVSILDAMAGWLFARGRPPAN